MRSIELCHFQWHWRTR